MSTTCQIANRRILVIDDNEAIHEDFHKIMGKPTVDEGDLWATASLLFGDSAAQPTEVEGFDIDSAHQGQEGLALVQKAQAEGFRYSLAFVDVRMPPGWDGIETVRRIWQVDAEILVVICTAYSDCTWEQMVAELGRSDRFLVLKKPFDTVEVRQLALALSERWRLARQAEIELDQVVQQVATRAKELEIQHEAAEQSLQEIDRLRTQLANAHRQVTETEAAKTAFLTALCDEIKPPTTAIYQFAEALRADGDITQAPVSRIQKIDAIIGHAQQLLDRVQPL